MFGEMIKKLHILFILMFTFVFVSTHTYANSLQQAMSCCSTINIDSSCHKNLDYDSSKKMSCKDHCKDFGCVNQINLGVTLSVTNFSPINLINFKLKKIYSHKEVFYSSNYNAIWQPPKIA